MWAIKINDAYVYRSDTREGCLANLKPYDRLCKGTGLIYRQTFKDGVYRDHIYGRLICINEKKLPDPKWYDVVNDYTLIECEMPDAGEWTTKREHQDFAAYFNKYDELIFACVRPLHYLYSKIVSNETNYCSL